MRTQHRLVSTATVAIILFSMAGFAQNLVGNGDFDADVSGWTPHSVIFEWDSADCHQVPASGSGRVTNDNDGTTNSGTTFCVDGVVGGQSYDLGGWAWVPTGQTGYGSASYGLYWRSGPGCGGTQTWVGQTPTVHVSNGWVPLAMFGLVAPPGTQSAQVDIGNNKVSPGTDPYVSYHDGIFFGSYGGIFADGFESGATNIWSTTQY